MQVSAERWTYGESFQIQVLALMLRDPLFLTRYADVIEHSYFEHQDLSILAYIVIREFKARSKTPNRDTMGFLIHDYVKTYDADGSKGLETRLTHWLGYVYDRVCDESFITSRLTRFAQRQSIKLALAKSIDWLEQDKPLSESDAKESVAERVERAVRSACVVGGVKDYGDMLHDVLPILPKLWRESTTAKTKVPTGIPGLDDALEGGLGAGELGAVMAPPNRGKSTLLVCFGTQAARYLRDLSVKTGAPAKAVIHVTLEQSKKAIELKYGAAVTGLPLHAVKQGESEYEAKVSQEMTKYGPVNVTFFTPGKTSVEELRWYISNLVMARNLTPGLLILDYADRLKGGEADRFLGMGNIYDTLIDISNTFEVPVWTATQVNRSNANNTTIDYTGAAESWKKVEAADVMISLSQTEAERAEQIARLYTAKVRDGRSQEHFYTRFDPSCVQLRSLTPAEIEEFHTSHPGADTNTNDQSRTYRTPKASPRRTEPAKASSALITQDFFATLPSGIS